MQDPHLWIASFCCRSLDEGVCSHGMGFITFYRSSILIFSRLFCFGELFSTDQQGVLAAVHAFHGDVARAQQLGGTVSHL